MRFQVPDSLRQALVGRTIDIEWIQLDENYDPSDTHRRLLEELEGPVDQQPPRHLHGGECVELLNLTPSGRLAFELPKVYLDFRTRVDRRWQEHRGLLSTVIIEPDRSRLILVWTTALQIVSEVDYLEETVVSEKPLV